MKPLMLLLLAPFVLLSPMLAGPAGAEAPAPESTAGPDLAKEQRWRDQIVDSLMDGDAVDLQAGDLTFLGLYTPADDPSGRAAIVVHGIGVHPNWPQVVYPLRTALPRQGWSTLSIQMPVLPNEASDADYAPLMDGVAPRLDAAIAYLREQGDAKVVIIAHSLGATMVDDYLAAHPDAVDAYVGIGISSTGPQAGRDNAALIRSIRVPMLDLFGQNDLAPVVSGAPARAEAGSANPGYHQAQVPGANHFFDGQDDALVQLVVDWLDATVPAR